MAVALGFCLSLSGMALANNPRASIEEVKQMLAKAITLIKAGPMEKAYAEFRNKDGAFFGRNLRVTVLDMEGKFLVNANNPRMLGKDATGARDAEGVPCIQDRMKIVKAKARARRNSATSS